MKNIIKLLMRLYFITVVLFAFGQSNELENVKMDFIKKSNSILKILNDKNISKNDKNNKVIEIISPMFDFKLMARLTLGKQWRNLKETEKNDFTQLYIHRMKNSYSKKVDVFSDISMKINSIKQQKKKNRALLSTELTGDNSSIKVDYKYHKPKQSLNNQWLIYDVIIEGISIVKNDKAQFNDILQRTSVHELLKKMKMKK